MDYDEVFAPVVRSTTFRIMLSTAAFKGFKVKHFDVKTAFLNGKIEEEIYMKQPEGFEIGNKVCKLKKGLYGLKQAARQWNKEVQRIFKENDYEQSKSDQCLYFKMNGDYANYVLIHVDDILMSSNNVNMINELQINMNKEFELKDLGEVKLFLGIEIEKDRFGNYMINQEKYIDEVVAKSGLDDAKFSKYPLDPGYEKIICKEKLENNKEYQKLIGMLLYISTNTRPDISASVSILSQKIKDPTKNDLNEVKRLIKYLKGTKELKLRLSNINGYLSLHAYSDANWAENRTNRKSNSGYICMVNGGTISWACRRQDCVSLSSTEAEYIALSESIQEMIWIKNICRDFKIVDNEAIKIYEDNQSCIKMTEKFKFSNRTKHIDTKYHFIKDLKEKKEVDVEYCATKNNIADMLTKPLTGERIKKLRGAANLGNKLSFEEEC